MYATKHPIDETFLVLSGVFVCCAESPKSHVCITAPCGLLLKCTLRSGPENLCSVSMLPRIEANWRLRGHPTSLQLGREVGVPGANRGTERKPKTDWRRGWDSNPRFLSVRWEGNLLNSWERFVSTSLDINVRWGRMGQETFLSQATENLCNSLRRNLRIGTRGEKFDATEPVAKSREPPESPSPPPPAGG
jgi:hypothetical protein